MSSKAQSGGFQIPTVADPRTIRPYMVSLGLAVKLAQGAFDPEHVARMEPPMARSLASAAEGAARHDVLKAKARPGTEPTMAASAGVTQPGERAFDSPVRVYDAAAQRSLTAAIQEKMQGDSSAAATAGPAWQSSLRDTDASRRGVVARSAEPGAAGRPLSPTKPPPRTGGGLEASMRKADTWRPAMRPQKNPPIVAPLVHAEAGPDARSPQSHGGSAASPVKGGDGSVIGFGGSAGGPGLAVTGGGPMSQSAMKLAGLPATSPLRAPTSPGSGAAAGGGGGSALTVRLRPNTSALEPAATLGRRSIGGGADSVVNFDAVDSRNPTAALAFKQLDTGTGDWAPKQFRSKAGAQLAHLPLTLTDAAIVQSDKRAARTHDRILKASILPVVVGGGGDAAASGMLPPLASSDSPGAQVPFAFSPGASAALRRPTTAPTAAGYMQARGSPARDHALTLGSSIAAPDPRERFVPGNTVGPLIVPHAEQGPPEGSSPKRPGTAAPALFATGGLQPFQATGASVGLLSRSLASPLQRPITAAASLRSPGSVGGGAGSPSRKELALIATQSLMRSHAAGAVAASKEAQEQRRAAQREAAAVAAARAREAMLHVQCAV